MGRGTIELASAALTAGSSMPYLVSISRHAARPQRMSWFVFTALSAVAAVSQLRTGSSAGAWLAAGSAVGFGAIFACSLRWGAGGWSRADRGTLAVAVLAVVLLLADRPLASLLTVIAAEVAAVALTVAKVSAAPTEEVWTSWAIDAVAGVAALAGVATWSFGSVVYPAHHVAVNVWVVLAVRRGRARQGQLSPRHA
ncbi:hypothetical protein [Desertimonas flava]|jgi:hypothetical protein|uniref:hypothetical protein n=1 Tax=Desertimonas flava TaxID=2064846 RepID=UPI000E34AB0B|nr:hypothetical protein [Desertimonas flava]